jgi:hypothetical protein
MRREGDRYEILQDGKPVTSGTVSDDLRITQAQYREVRRRLAMTITSVWDKAVAGEPLHPAEQEALGAVLDCLALPWNLSG